MTNLDLQTQAWLNDMFFCCGANVYGPDQLKEELAFSALTFVAGCRGEWLLMVKILRSASQFQMAPVAID